MQKKGQKGVFLFPNSTDFGTISHTAGKHIYLPTGKWTMNEEIVFLSKIREFATMLGEFSGLIWLMEKTRLTS